MGHSSILICDVLSKKKFSLLCDKMVICCIPSGLFFLGTNCGQPDVLLFGDSGIEYWTSPGAPVCCLPNSTWKELKGEMKSRNLSVMSMGCNSGPVSELCCVAPFVLCKNKPKKIIVTQMGSNDLVWYPLCFLRCCTNKYPKCGFDFFMRHVKNYGQPGVKVVMVAEVIGTKLLPVHRKYFEEVKASAGTVITPVPSSTDLKDPQWTYTVTSNSEAQHSDLIYLDSIAAFEPLIKVHGRSWIGSFEAKPQVYKYWNQHILHIVDTYGSGEAGSPDDMEMVR